MAVTLSQIQAWSTAQLTDAASYWTKSADHWEDVFLTMRNQSQSVAWQGAGGDSLRQRTGADLTVVSGKADRLRQAAGIARSGASDISTAKQQALHAIEDAQNAGFTVGEDLSVSYTDHGGSVAQQAARQAQAEQMATEIWSRAGQLEAADAKVAGQITAAAGDVGNVSFGSPRNGVNLVDFKQDGGPQSPPSPWDLPDKPPETKGNPAHGSPKGLPKPLQDFLDFQLKGQPIPNPPAPNVTADQLRMALMQQHIDYDKFVAWFNQVHGGNVTQAELLQRIGTFDAAVMGGAVSPAGGPIAMGSAAIGILISGYQLFTANPGDAQIPVPGM